MKKKQKKPWAVFAAIVLAIIFGLWIGPKGNLWGIPFFSIFDVAGKLFLNALVLIVVPLVSSSIIIGIARIGSDTDFKRLGAKTFGFYLGTSFLAIVIGYLFTVVIHPGSPQKDFIQSTTGSEALAQVSAEITNPLAEILFRIVPSNIIQAFSQGQMLGIIFFCMLFGYAISKIDSGPASILQGFFEGVFQAMIRVTHIIMKFLPLGVFCLVAKVFMTTGIGSLASVALFGITVLLGLLAFMLIGLPLLLKFIGRVSPLRHFKAMSPALITAFSTSSSSATLPVTMDCVEKRAGVSSRICSLVIPLGTSVNMSGSALYICSAVFFVAQALDVTFSLQTQIMILFLSLISSIGVAGIPSASLVGIIVVMKVVGLPPEGIALFIAVDRLLDMCRATVNVFSDSCCAVLVATTEGESKVLSVDPSSVNDK